MSDEPKSIWRRPWQGRAKIFGWWAILASATFVFFLCIGLASAKANKLSELALTALAVSVGIATLVTAGLWFVRWLCCWRNFRRFLVTLAGFATLIAIFYAEENWRGKRSWKNYVLKQEARGERMDLAAFIPPLIPDDQNLTVCPLLKPVLDFRYPNDQDGLDGRPLPSIIWLDTNGVARLARLDLHWNMRNYLHSLSGEDRQRLQEQVDMEEVKKQAEANTLTNGWINLALWQAYYRMSTNLTGANPENSPAQDVLFALRRVEHDLTEIHREAGRRPLARWPVHYDLEQPWSTLLPHLANVKRITMLLQVRAAAQLVANQTGEGLADIELGFRLADSLGGEPFVISQLVRMACYDIILQPLNEGLARHQFSDAQLTSLQQQLSAADLLAGFQRSMRGERAISGLWANLTRENLADLIQAFSGSQEFTERLSYFALCSRVVPKGWIYQNQLYICRLFDDYVLSAVDVQTRTVHPKGAEAFLTAKREAKGPFSALAECMMMFKAFGDDLPFPCKFAHGQTQVDLARVACGLERYHLAHGQYPEALDALAPQFITKLPHDVINGQPLKYRRADDGSFVLYSVGWNEKDDGGFVPLKKDDTTLNRREERKTVNLTEGDWVWTVPIP
ncbi:MAG: hypothetical protein HOP33_22050 [Verrucomicrobia bacterium]|nr:hypothetical protein [Verrucomicrobiota bacterium]